MPIRPASSPISGQCGLSHQPQRATGVWLLYGRSGHRRLQAVPRRPLCGIVEPVGRDGAAQTFNRQSLLPKESSYSLNFTANYNISTFFNPFVEASASWSKGTTYSPYNTYDDSIPISLENPFIPAALRALVNAEIAADPSVAATAQIALSRDHADIFDPEAQSDRRTYRAVVGTRGELDLGWKYELSFNYGRTEQDTTFAVRLEDRFFAAIDAVTDPVTDRRCAVRR